MAALNSEMLDPFTGDTSTRSTPTTLFFAQTALNRRSASYHRKPPGCGVPVPGMTDGSKPSESSVIKKVAYEPIYLNHLRNVLNIKSVKRVSMHEPLTNLRRFGYVAFDDSATKTEIWRALQGAAALMPAVGKFCIAISQDIDPLSADHVLWALAYRCNPIEDVHIVPYRSRGHGPELKGVKWESTMLVDATLKSTMPPISLPKKEYMERAKQIWEELGLPKLEPQEPRHGYFLGLWPEEFDREAQLATQGDYDKVGEKLKGDGLGFGEVLPGEGRDVNVEHEVSSQEEIAGVRSEGHSFPAPLLAARVARRRCPHLCRREPLRDAVVHVPWGECDERSLEVAF